MVAENAEKAANKNADMKKRHVKKRQRADLRATEKKAMKAAESDPQRLLPGLNRRQFAWLKLQLMCNLGVSFASQPEEEAPLPTSAAAMPVQAEIAAETRSKKNAKERKRAELRAAELLEHRSLVLARFAEHQSLVLAQTPSPYSTFSTASATHVLIQCPFLHAT
jgi:hypothetical protein